MLKHFVFLLAMMFVSASVWADNQTCLSYTKVGDSSCDQPVSKTTVDEGGMLPAPLAPLEEVVDPNPVPPKEQKQPVVPEKTKEESLDERIDEYMESYGKPPREFVAFNLEPTLENALKWAKKYRELMERNRKLTAAWGQAQTILNEMEDKGMEVPGYEPMSDIPDYGVGVPNGFQGFAGDLPSQQTDYAGIAANSTARQGAPTIGFAEGDGNAISANSDEGVVNKGSSALIGGESVTPAPKVESGLVDVSYYFSAECPYCKKFEEGFKGLVQKMKGEVKVTCVDMTPSGRTKANIHGKIDCSWRAAIPGEATALGVTSTPTLIIDRKMGHGLEKVEGLVDITKLEAFLRGDI